MNIINYIEKKEECICNKSVKGLTIYHSIIRTSFIIKRRQKFLYIYFITRTNNSLIFPYYSIFCKDKNIVFLNLKFSRVNSI